MKNLRIIALVLILICFVLGPVDNIYATNTNTSQSNQISETYTPQQTFKLINEKKDLLIIDVRSPKELKDGKIAGSTLIPVMDILSGNFSIPKDRSVLLVCAVGGRSLLAMKVLAYKGYNELYNLKGGIAAWAEEKLPLVY